jgi:CHAD domain-containing protein
MPVDQEHCRSVFQKLSRQLTRVTKHSGPDTVHKFRTSTRRVETVVEELVPNPDRGTRKLLKSLRRLRKKAGKVRDLDVHIASLRNLKVTREEGQKSHLLRALTAERLKREKKLAGTLDKETIRELRKRLKKACSKVQIPADLDPISVAMRELSAVSRDRAPLNQKTVHEYRIAGKRARYVIEIAGKDAEAQLAIENLKKMQDVVGDWHDWLTLTERAEKLFGGVKDSALVAAMRNLTRAKYRESVDGIIRMKAMLVGETSTVVPSTQVARKPSAVPLPDQSAAA